MLNIQQSIPLAPFTTFGIGGNAKFFVEVGSVEELTEAVRFARNDGLEIFVLGGGSNILISDEGFDGLVIKMDIRGLWINDIASRLSTGGYSRYSTVPSCGVVLNAGAGEIWDDVVAKAVELNAGGIENLSLIPGTVGGAVYQNIGAYGAELKDILTSVKAYNISTGEIMRLSNKECDFGYRDSIFQKNKNFIILEAEIMLFKNRKPNISYPDIQKKFGGQTPSLTEVRRAIVEIRQSKLVPPDKLGNAGSFFKNPIIKISNYQFLISQYPDLNGRKIGNDVIKMSAAQFIEKAGFKGRRIENVGISEKHALVLVNYGNGTAKELIDFAGTVKEAVKAKFGVKLEAEVELV